MKRLLLLLAIAGTLTGCAKGERRWEVLSGATVIVSKDTFCLIDIVIGDGTMYTLNPKSDAICIKADQLQDTKSSGSQVVPQSDPEPEGRPMPNPSAGENL